MNTAEKVTKKFVLKLMALVALLVVGAAFKTPPAADTDIAKSNLSSSTTLTSSQSMLQLYSHLVKQ